MNKLFGIMSKLFKSETPKTREQKLVLKSFDEKRFRQAMQKSKKAKHQGYYRSTKLNIVDGFIDDIRNMHILDQVTPEEAWGTIGSSQRLTEKIFRNSKDFTDFCVQMFEDTGCPGGALAAFWLILQDKFDN